MKSTRIKTAILGILLWSLPVLAPAENVIEMPPSGTDINNYRCSGKIIGIGYHVREVVEKCGEPVGRGVMDNRKYDIWVYHVSGEKFVYYLAFLQRRLQRIYLVSCHKNDPYCQ